MSWFDEDGNYVYPPKVGGDPIIVTPTKIERKEYPPDTDKNYKDKNKKDTGYRDEFILEDGKIMPCNIWSLYFAIKESGAKPNQKIQISHPDRGKYEVLIVDDDKENWGD